MNYFVYERQWPLVGYQDLVPTDFATAAAVDFAGLPEGATITHAWIDVKVAFNSATTATLSIGDKALATRYGSAIDLKTTGRKPLANAAGFTTAEAGQLVATFAQTGTAATAGSARVYFQYVAERKSDEIQD
ncbi:hypothetical protein KDX38_11005 [Pseudomonas sp. CDFA 602]|uniref:hypothetical protein n=1 Tax=Pseudomonas californiensis TaxID=2829823 RepID=UPI001E2D932D|nr:hypothetical protein [Pseudomonas californiensis]MCD5994154.1 hypothetical protein [Pseudomonas californiensis]MCD5999747.1 hypothetical protein [Pseudomonas californiensis]